MKEESGLIVKALVYFISIMMAFYGLIYPHPLFD